MRFLAPFVLTVALTSGAFATVTFHGTRAAAFGAATTSYHDFEGYSNNSFEYLNGPFVDGDLTVSGGTNFYWISDSFGYRSGSDVLSGQQGATNSLSFSFGATKAFAMDWSTWDSQDVQVNLSNGDSFVLGGSSFEWKELAFTSDSDFTSVTFTTNGYVLNSDNVEFAPVPEPTSMAALALGAVAMVRRRRNQA